MHGELTDKETAERVERALDHHLADQLEILLYKKNSWYYIFLYYASIKIHTIILGGRYFRQKRLIILHDILPLLLVNFLVDLRQKKLNI